MEQSRAGGPAQRVLRGKRSFQREFSPLDFDLSFARQKGVY
jgi:hypothetical protein